MADLATAYVRLIPSLKGSESTIKKELEGAVGASEGSKLGSIFGGGFSSGFSGALGGVASAAAGAAKAVGTAAVAATGAAAAGVAAVGKQAYDAYGDFEQLEGGVETLFQDSAGTVMANAQNAFKTAGMSANDYMENVTGFSASLLQSLGGDTAAAASYADRAITDMADNANKMGTSMSSITNAYQGFAKQNYTMLDNLKLGYGGTQAEMQRLVAEAAQMTEIQEELGVAVDASSLSFDNVVNAISVVQKSMGIAGTTAKEATSTLQGSAGMMKASWQNLITEIGKPDADMGSRMAEFADTVRTALLGSLNEETGEMEGGIIRIASRILENIAAALPGATEIIVSTIGEVLPLITDVISNTAPQLIDALGQVITALAEALPDVIVALVPVIIALVPHIVEAGIQLFLGLARALYEAWPEISAALANTIIELAHTIGSHGPDILVAAIELALMIAQGIVMAAAGIIGALVELLASLVLSVAEAAAPMAEAAGELMASLLGGVNQGFDAIYNAVVDIKQRIADLFAGAATWLYDSGVSIITGLRDGIMSAVGSVTDSISGAVASVRNLFPFSPAKEGPFSGKGWVLYSGIAIMDALAQGAEQQAGKTVAAYQGIADKLQSTLGLEDSVKVSYANPARPQAVSYGATAEGQKGITINIGEMTVRDKSDADYFADVLYKKLSREGEGALWT